MFIPDPEMTIPADLKHFMRMFAVLRTVQTHIDAVTNGRVHLGWPREWYEGDRNGLSRLIETMCKRHSSIRDLITAFRESTRNPFPNWANTPSVFIPAAMQSEQPEGRA